MGGTSARPLRLAPMAALLARRPASAVEACTGTHRGRARCISFAGCTKASAVARAGKIEPSEGGAPSPPRRQCWRPRHPEEGGCDRRHSKSPARRSSGGADPLAKSCETRECHVLSRAPVDTPHPSRSRWRHDAARGARSSETSGLPQGEHVGVEPGSRSFSRRHAWPPMRRGCAPFVADVSSLSLERTRLELGRFDQVGRHNLA